MHRERLIPPAGWRDPAHVSVQAMRCVRGDAVIENRRYMFVASLESHRRHQCCCDIRGER